tara:strand:- start:25 stop:717 length:693 start_codon:yes stop_codon:yes gene_type:complete
MSDKKLKLELSSPFGPTILKAELPQDLMKDLNEDCDAIVSKKREGVDWSHELAGRVKEEWHISKDTLSKYYGWVGAVTSRYLFPTTESFEQNKDKVKIGIASGWYVRQFEGDFNPYHFHTGCQISCVGYLKMPEDINEYWKEEDKDHNPYGGYIDFRYGTIGLNCPNNVKLKPQVGDFYMFPNWLDHSVYPFKSKYKYPDTKGERRSFSMNIAFSFDKSVNYEQKDRNKS